MASTTTRKPRVRKPKAETPVEAVEAAIEAGTAIVLKVDAEAVEKAVKAIETPEVEIVIDPKVVKRLADLTEVTKQALQAEAAADEAATLAFYEAASALREIRDNDLVALSGIVSEKTGEPFTFDTYVEETFGKSRDLGDKWARAANVIDRLRAELTPAEQEQFPLPTNEGQARPLGFTLTKDPDSKDKLASSIWIQGYDVAEKRVKDEAEKKGTGFIPAAVVPTVRDVTKAREIVVPKPKRKPAPKPKLGADADPLAKKLRTLATTKYPEVKFDTLIDILVEGVKLQAQGAAIREQAEIVRITL